MPACRIKPTLCAKLLAGPGDVENCYVIYFGSSAHSAIELRNQSCWSPWHECVELAKKRTERTQSGLLNNARLQCLSYQGPQALAVQDYSINCFRRISARAR